MTGELIRIINYDTPRKPRRRALREAWARTRAGARRLVHSHPKTVLTAHLRNWVRL
jgi:hypothetical protein